MNALQCTRPDLPSDAHLGNLGTRRTAPGQARPPDHRRPRWTGRLLRIGLTLLAGGLWAAPICAQADVESAANRGDITTSFQQLHRRSTWRLEHQLPLAFDTFHPQGLTATDDAYFLSTVEIRRPVPRRTDQAPAEPTAGRGQGHLIVFTRGGEFLRSIELGAGDLYHPGGIDRDQHYIWVPVAEYRPHSRSIIYRVRLTDFAVEELFRVPDHIGAVVRDPERNRLIGWSWGGRRIYAWPLDAQGGPLSPPTSEPPDFQLSPQHYIDYQDCQYLGGGLALCSGLATYNQPGSGRFTLGGIDLVELDHFRPLHQLPIELYTDGQPRRVMTQNPMFVERSPAGLRFHFIPEDGPSRLYIYEALSE